MIVDVLLWAAVASFVSWKLGAYCRDRVWKRAAWSDPKDPVYLCELWIGDERFYVVRCDDVDRIEWLYRDAISVRRAKDVIKKTLGNGGPRVSIKEEDDNP